MAVQSRYIARKADANGVIQYTQAEHARWQCLMQAQMELLPRYAAPVYLEALERLALPQDHMPQCHEVSRRLLATSGWRVVPVPALIDFSTFFAMLARRQFPAASFIRSQQEMDYLQEPDIFHEILGHAPLLTNTDYADFVQAYGAAGCRASPSEQAWLARLFWFTIEFGLLQTDTGIRALGAGIVSSSKELPYALDDPTVERRAFDEIDILGTPYRIDILQPVYFVLDNLEQLFQLTHKDLISLVRKARALGLDAAQFERNSA
ncbi:MAG: phenylalanine 4-monooxygenase [Gammaproteobacteria bacterium]|nr:phenylalanine 4-monooxygenase [Gammaproteobacteria bacterium]